ncbi:hypothetical protein YDYSG_45260 [Paenibacillus tyrfis]|nr:hypothetical protein YDYSG_45260 [Paenibacillus tyrfis]
MKKLSVVLLLFGTIVMFIGILPFIFTYPYCHGCVNSGPSTWRELVLVLSYEGKGRYLAVGIALLLLSIPLLIQQRKARL